MTNAAHPSISDEERLAWLRLIRSENVGPVICRQLLSHFGSAAAALAELPTLARRRGRKIRICPREEAERELERIAAHGARLVVLAERDYPALLREIVDPPPVLTLLGSADFRDRPAVALVGARNASGNGRRLVHRFAAELGRAGCVVVSGLARGIDGAAHEGALDHGTIAVSAGGADVVYPPEHKDLHRRICERGLVVSEQPWGLAPTARHFPRRNRLISGLSLGVVVVEAAVRSGSLITARMALEQGRALMAVPGSPQDPRARGGNQLIRNGALLVQDPEEVLECLAPMFERPVSPIVREEPGPPISELPADGQNDQGRDGIESLLGTTPILVDELIRQSGLPPPVVNLVLIELELEGRIERQPGNRVALLADSQ